MKTLKQQIEESVTQTLIETNIIDTEDDYTLDKNVETAIINGVKEWLTQKQQEYQTQTDFELTINQVFKELIEELNQ